MTSRCEQHPGMCCHDNACPDKHCEGRPETDEPAIGYEAARLIQDEGGITYAGDEPVTRRAGRIDWWMLAVLGVLAATAFAFAVWWH